MRRKTWTNFRRSGNRSNADQFAFDWSVLISVTPCWVDPALSCEPHTLNALASGLMAVLGRQAILKAIDRGAITITPFDPVEVGPASVDLTLANSFRVFRKVHEVVDVDEHTDYRSFTDKVVVDDGDHILIMPGETILGIPERLRLSPGLCGWLEGRSRFCSSWPDGAYQCPIHGAWY